MTTPASSITSLRPFDLPPPPPLGTLEEEINLVIESNILAGNLNKSLILIHQRTQFNPEDPTLKYLNAEAYFTCGYNEKALVLFQELDQGDPCVQLYLLHCQNKIKPSPEMATQIQAVTKEYMEECSLPFEQECYVDDLYQGRYSQVLEWIYRQPFYQLSYDLLLTQACIKLRMGETADCLKTLKALMEISPNNLQRRPFYLVTPGVRGWMEQNFTYTDTLPTEILLAFARLFSEFKEDTLAVTLFHALSKRFPKEGYIHALTALQEAILGNAANDWQSRFEYSLTHCLDNEKAEITFYYAKAFFASQQWDTCISRLDLLNGEMSKESKYYILLGEVLLKKQLYQRAKECYERACTLFPNNPTFWKGKGICEFALENYQEALHCFNEAVAIYPFHPAYFLWRARSQYGLKKDPSLVLADFKLALLFNPNACKELLREIQAFIERGNVKGALREAELMVLVAPEDSEGWWHLAKINIDLGYHLAAKNALEHYLTLKTLVDEPRHLIYVTLLLKVGLSEAARNHLERHRGLSAKAPLSYYALYLDTFRGTSDYRRELEKFLRKWPDSPLQLIELAILKIRAKKYGQAVTDLEKAFQLDANPRTKRLIDWLNNHLTTPQNHLTPYSENPLEEQIRFAELFFRVWQKVKGPKIDLCYDVMSNAPHRINILVLEFFYEKKEWQCPLLPKTPFRQLLDEEVTHLTHLLHSRLPGAFTAARLSLFKAVKLTVLCPRHPYLHLDTLINQASDPEAFNVLDLDEAYRALHLTPPKTPLKPLFEEDTEPLPEWLRHPTSLLDPQVHQSAPQ